MNIDIIREAVKLICDGCDDILLCCDCPERDFIDSDNLEDDSCVTAHIVRRLKGFIEAHLQSEGYRKLDDWHHAAEMLPEVNAEADLWATDGVAVWKAYYTVPTKAADSNGRPCFCFKVGADKSAEYAACHTTVTHWMPYYWIPAPPKTEELPDEQG